MAHLSPPPLTQCEQQAILVATACNPRDHVIYSLALGTGLRLAEIVGLNVGDVFAPDGTPRSRVRIRAEIAKVGRAGELFHTRRCGRRQFGDRRSPAPLAELAPYRGACLARVGDSGRAGARCDPITC